MLVNTGESSSTKTRRKVQKIMQKKKILGPRQDGNKSSKCTRWERVGSSIHFTSDPKKENLM